jgi:hypothetical protein
LKFFLREPHQGRSGSVALILFLLAYTATMALVIAPDQVKSALDAPLTWPFE